jgi:Skp family chaperone for outer membrane proteins
MTHSPLAKMAATLLALACLTGTAQEPVKIATVDLLKAFDSYWKTKLSNDQLKERGTDFDKVRIGMIEDLNLLREEYNRLNVSIQDQANAEEKRADDQKKAQVKLAEFKHLEQQVIEFNKNAQKTLGDQTQRLRKGRLDEIQTVISAKAKELGYDWVIDSSQDVMLPRTPTVLFTNGKNITSVII